MRKIVCVMLEQGEQMSEHLEMLPCGSTVKSMWSKHADRYTQSVFLGTETKEEGSSRDITLGQL